MQVPIDTTSIAIWNRNKAAIALSITVWGINTAFHIKSKPFSSPFPIKDLELCSNLIRRTGAAQVDDSFQFLWIHLAHLTGIR
jgi:hypothetical protein